MGNQTGKSQQQGQMSGQGMQYADRDILQVCMNEAKHMASSLNTYIQEAKSEQLRRDYMTVLGDVYNQQKQLYDYMEQKGFYNVKEASAQDIAKAQSEFSSQGQQQQSMQ